jgi:hypothetical protein
MAKEKAMRIGASKLALQRLITSTLFRAFHLEGFYDIEE